jgi:hypothetical protein
VGQDQRPAKRGGLHGRLLRRGDDRLCETVGRDRRTPSQARAPIQQPAQACKNTAPFDRTRTLCHERRPTILRDLTKADVLHAELTRRLIFINAGAVGPVRPERFRSGIGPSGRETRMRTWTNGAEQGSSRRPRGLG